MYLLHGRSIALAAIIKVVPKLPHGVPSGLSATAFSAALDLFNAEMQDDVSYNR